MRKRHKIIILLTLCITFFFVIYRAIFISQFEESKRRNFMRGDGYSDVNLYSAVLHFNDSGLTNTKGLPVHYYKVPLADTSFHPIVYTHYPALPDILAYGYSKIICSVNESLLRCFIILLSLLYAYVLWKVLSAIIKDENIALLSWVIILLSNYFIGWSDSLHKHVYEEFSKALFIWILLKYLSSGKPALLGGLFLTMCFASNVSYEPVVYLAVVCVGISLWQKKGLFSAITIIPALGAIVGVLLHLWQNIAWFGGWEKALADLTETAKLRTAGIELTGIHKKLESPFGWQEFMSLPFVWLNRVERFYMFPSFALIAMWYMVRKEFKALLNRDYYQWLLILWIASFSWCIVMAQHAYVHSFTMRQAGLFYALFAGPVVYLFYNKIRNGFRDFNLATKIFIVLLISYSLIMFLTQQVWDLWLKNTLVG